MSSVTNLPDYMCEPSYTSGVGFLTKLSTFNLLYNRREQYHSNPQLSNSSSAVATLSLPMPLQQRHSTGSLSVVDKEAAPRKGILKRPHTFNLGTERPSFVFPHAIDKLSVSIGQRFHHQMNPLSVERKERRNKMEEEDKVAQRVEFAEKNAVTIFGDTTTDTDTGTDTVNTRKNEQFHRKNAMAIVTPVVREENQPKVLLGTDGNDVRHGRGPLEDTKLDGVSHIVGKWWFGKSTKFVVHCDKRGCSAAGHSSREETPTDGAGHRHGPQQNNNNKSDVDMDQQQPYLTPTQRKQREINALKKELRRSQMLCRDKEHHLTQLKERLDEIERLMASSNSAQLIQYARLKQKLAERESEFAHEKEALIERHEHRMRQMNQEMSDLRTDLKRKEKTIDELVVRRAERRDRAVQVDDFVSFEQFGIRRESNSSAVAPLSPSLVPATALGWAPPDSEKVVEYFKDVPFGGDEKRPDGPGTNHEQMHLFHTVSKSAPVSPSSGPTALLQPQRQKQTQIESQLLATLDAYRAETVVWRTRTAQLELILQDLLLREGAATRGPTTEAHFAAAITQTNQVTEANATESEEERDQQQSDVQSDSFFSQQLHRQSSLTDGCVETKTHHQKRMAPSEECQRRDCVERCNHLEEDMKRMQEKITFLSNEVAQKESERDGMAAELCQMSTRLENLKTEHASLVDLAETRLCEVKAIQMTLNGTEAKRNKLEQALEYIERRCHVMEQIGLDQGIVLVERDEFPQSPGDVFTFKGSKSTQTTLTAKALGYSERELDELQIQIQAMQVAFSEDKASMGDQLSNIEQMLTMKTELVTTLTTQLENAAKNARLEDERHQRERDAFSERIGELSMTAERVPILENELERARCEKSLCELRIKRMEAERDERMEKILAETMRNSKQNEEYWSEKCGELERKIVVLVAQLEHQQKVTENERMGWQMDRLELDCRLHSAIEYASVLNARLNCPRRDAQCDVRPRSANKYVICRPNQHDKGVEAGLLDAEVENMRQTICTMETEREWMQLEMDKMGREIADRVERPGKTLRQRKQKNNAVLPELTVTFHHGSGDIVHLGGPVGSDVDCAQEDKTQISMVSLPTVLDHSDGSLPYIGHAHITTKNMLSSHRSLSFQLQMPHGEAGTNFKYAAERSHSESRTDAIEQTIAQISANEKTNVHDELTYSGQFEVLRARIRELMCAIMSRDSSESATEVQREAKLNQIFDELGWWMRTMAEDERTRLELREQAEAMHRENDQLREQLRNALVELEVYRTEPRRTAWERWTVKMGRSSSAEQLSHGGRPPLTERQLNRWKQIAGTTFREVNVLRKQLTSAEADRLSLRNCLTILRGELVMEKCQKNNARVLQLERRRGRRGSVDRLLGFDPNERETLPSYNRWLGGDRWQSVPELDDNEKAEQQKMQKTVAERSKRRDSGEKITTIVHEALKKQLGDMRQRIELIKERKEEEISAKSLELVKVKAECELLRRENGMYEQKCNDMDRERQQMYLIMFRKGQQAANMELAKGEDGVDNASELQVVLRFLHDAFFYYLLNKGNAIEHMQAIMTMLNFTAEQKEQVYKRRGKSH